MNVSAIIPVFYTEPDLERTLERLVPVRQRIDLEIILVVDCPDPGRELECRVETDRLADHFEARVLYGIGERGFGAALRASFPVARGGGVVPFMGNLCDDPDDIPTMVGELAKGFDVVAGSRYMPEGRIIGNTAKQRLSRLYSMLVCRIAGLPIHDLSNAFKLYRREVVQSVSTVAESFDISVELTLRAARAGFRLSEVPTVWRNREVGHSHFNFSQELRRYWRWLRYAAAGRTLDSEAHTMRLAPSQVSVPW
jgi:glycosyltransferase involved in cell wall biosynthesis